MFTANLAGSASSHLRPYDRNRDTSHSRLSICQDQANELEEAKKRLGGSTLEVTNNQEANYERLEVDPEQLQAILDERRRDRFMRDYKTWAYLGTCCIIIIGAIVLIVLAALGRLKN